ncbi:MAG: sigma-70 family RNA polymerase sigma factor [Bacillota bacterium]
MCESLAVELTGPARYFGNEKFLENVLGLLYTTGFRLTGDHREAAGLVEGAISAIGTEDGLYPALKELSRQYIEGAATARDRMVSADGQHQGLSGREQLVQEALLHLPAGERLVVVLRDVLGLSYAEISEAAGMNEPAVARTLAVGRRRLAERLIPKIKQGGF